MTTKRTTSDDSHFCQFAFADGRRCRMLRHKDHPSLCIFHSRAERQLLESDRLGTELASSLTGQFMTATDVNFVLGKLFTATAQNRIPPRNAAILAFIGQLMLHSLPKVDDEFSFHCKFEDWQKMLKQAIRLSNPSNPPGLDSPADPEKS